MPTTSIWTLDSARIQVRCSRVSDFRKDTFTQTILQLIHSSDQSGPIPQKSFLQVIDVMDLSAAIDTLLQNSPNCVVHRIGTVDLVTSSAAACATAGLRSAESMTVAEHGFRHAVIIGDRSFATDGPRAWNRLPSHLRLMQSADR